MKTPIEEAAESHASRVIKEGVMSEGMRSVKAYQFKNIVTSPEAEVYYRAKFLEERESSLKDLRERYEKKIRKIIDPDTGIVCKKTVADKTTKILDLIIPHLGKPKHKAGCENCGSNNVNGGYLRICEDCGHRNV